MTDQEYLREAINLARAAVRSGTGGPFGAVIVRDGQIIGQGRNRVTSAHDPSAHAEIMAIRDACRQLETHQLQEAVIYCSCKPCPMCLGAIYWARMAGIVYAADSQDAAHAGFDDNFFYRELEKAPEDRSIPSRQIPLAERLEPFREWEERIDKIEY